MKTKINHSKICQECGNTFFKVNPTTSATNFQKRKYCSVACASNSTEHRSSLSASLKGRTVWNKGKKGLQVAWNKGNSEYAKSLGLGKWMQGKKQSDETRLKNGQTLCVPCHTKTSNFKGRALTSET